MKELQDRFDRIPWVNVDVLRNLTALVVGLGNLGSPVAYMLYSMGIGKIHLIDKDIVDISNLPRQFLSSISDIGKPKATVAAKTLKKRFGGYILTDVVAMSADVRYVEIPWEEINFVFSCVDNPDARKFVLEQALKYNIPLIDMGLEFREGQFGYALLVDRKVYPDGACVDCYANLSEGAEDLFGCIAGAASYTGMAVASGGIGLFVQHIFKHLRRRANYFCIDFNVPDSWFNFLKQRNSCNTCGGG
jgi:hypothetical protein